RTYRTIYPVVHRDVLAAEAAEHELDPALVAALIRQESNFQANARSAANARGLMQLLPSVGRGIARAMDFPVWEDALLYEPDVNVRLGTAHLASLMKEYDGVLPNVLAAYNAGGSRVTRWQRKTGADDDPELFAERIPYDETRDYVRIVERNRAIYRALYPW
ncbi:MAG TPA: lytic transglycosylase domain-containing protein, partial [Gemmatimonadaceae bacterium]